MVRARADRADDLLRLGRREHELHVLRRLLDDLEQRVEALRRHHVRLVDDVDLVAAARRAERRALTQVTRVVDTTVRGRVDLDDVDAAGTATSERHARVAHPARPRRRALHAVEATREDARRRRLATPARTTEQVRVIDAPRPQRLHEGFGDVLLADDVGERLGAVAAVQGRCHASNTSGARRQPRDSAENALRAGQSRLVRLPVQRRPERRPPHDYRPRSVPGRLMPSPPRGGTSPNSPRAGMQQG